MSLVRRIHEWLGGAARHRIGIRALQIAIALSIIVRCFTELPQSAWLFGPHGLGTGGPPAMFGPLGAVSAWCFASTTGVVVLFVAQLCAALMLLAGVSTRVATFALLFTYLSFESRFPQITDGGDNLARLALMYMLLLLPARAKAAQGSVRTWLHNLGVALLIGQVVILYFTAGMMKAQGSQWMQGTALYMISQVEWVSLPGLRDVFKHSIVTVSASYMTLAFQVMFPVGVFSRFKLLFLALGMGFHVGIGLFMGLVTFSAVMIGAEAFLIDDEEYSDLFARARRVVDRVRARFESVMGRSLVKVTP